SASNGGLPFPGDRDRQEPDMKRFLPIDLSLVLSLATVLGMAMAAAGRWLPSGSRHSKACGFVIVYLAGGLPTAWCALSSTWCPGRRASRAYRELTVGDHGGGADDAYRSR